MKKILILIIIGFLVLTGCDDEKESIAFRITWKAYSGRGEAITRIVNDFNKTQMDYYVQVYSGDEDLSLIDAALKDNTFDVYVLPYRYVQKYNATALMPLSHATSSIYDSLIELGTVDDQLYGLPWVSHSMALIYNKTQLDSLGIDVDKIQGMDAFVQVLDEVEEKTDMSGIGLVGANHHDISWMVNQFVYGYEGILIEDDEVLVNPIQIKHALTTYRDTLGAHAQASWLTDTGTEVMSCFRDEQVAFEIQGPWGVTDIWKNNAPFEVGVLPLSQIGIRSEVGPMMLAIDKDIPDGKITVINEFLDYMISVEAQEKITHGEYSPERNEYYPFRLPVRKDLENSEIMKKYQVFHVFQEAYDYPSIDVPDPRWMVIKEQVYTKNLHAYMQGEITAEAFVLKVKKESKTFLEGTND